MTLASLEQRLVGLQQQYRNLAANSALVQGAIQLCEQLVEEMKQEDAAQSASPAEATPAEGVQA